MAQSIQPLRRSILSKSQNLLKFLQIQSQIQNPISKSTNFHSIQSQFQSRSYASKISEMSKSDFENNMLRLIQNEADFERTHFPSQQPPSEFNGFKVEDPPGETWIALSKKYGEGEKISVEVTLFDGSVPIPTEGDKPNQPGEEEHLHITMIITISKGESNQTFKFICSAWPDTVEIEKIFVSDRSKKPCNGRIFGELDDQLQNSFYDFLEERGIDDELCVFLHSYINYKSKAEFIRWIESVGKVLKKN